MSRFAIWYNDEDASKIAGAVSRSDLTTQERQYANRLWNAGLKDWATAPVTLSPCDDPTLPFDGKQIVIDGAQVSKQDTINWLRSIGNRLGNDTGDYLLSLALDVEQCAVEPFP